MQSTAGHPHDKPHHPHWPLALLLFGFVLLLGLLSVHATETWIHLKTGAALLAERRLPRTDPFSYSASGVSWTTDSWLFDLLAARLDAWGGAGLLIFAKSLAIAAAFALLLPINHGSPLSSAVLLSLGACAGWTGWVETPAALDPLLFAAFVRLLRPRHRFRWTQAAGAAALTALWANAHGSSALLALWLVGLKVFKASLRTAARERLGYWAMFVAAALALSWNPLGWDVLGRSFVDAAAPAGGWPAPMLSLHTALAFGALLSCWFTLQQEFVTTLACATVVALSLALPGLRPLGSLAACPVIALALGHWLRPRDDTWPRVLRWGALAVFLLAAYYQFVTKPLSGLRGYAAPALAGAAHYLKVNAFRGRMFNEPAAGAELIGLANRPVFVDERPGVYSAAFRRDAAAWPRLFRQLHSIYRFDYAVLLNRRVGAPARVIDEDPDWRLAYADDDALIYARRDGADSWALAGQPERRLAPNRLWPSAIDAALADKRRAPRVLVELDHWLVQAPDSAQALLWKAYAFDRLGMADKARRLLDLAAERPRLRRHPELQAALGFTLEARGEIAPAKAAYREAIRLAALSGVRELEAEVLFRLIALHRRLGEDAEAQELEGRAKSLPSPR